MARAFDFILGLAALLGIIAFGVWLFIRALRKSDDPLRLTSRWAITVVLLPGLVIAMTAGPYAPIFLAAIGIVIGIVWAPSWAVTLCSPLTNALDGGIETDEKPLYSIAEAKRKLGKYPEAIAAIQEELERFPRDFPGQMLLAEIQAVNLHDLPAASQTIEALIAQPGHPPINITFALSRLADWHAAAGEDEAARRSLDAICQLFPDTEHAYHASQRLAHLNPARREEQKQTRRMVVKPSEGSLGLSREFRNVQPPPEDWDAKVQKLVDQLEAYPADNEAREDLALIYARHYQQLDVALDQFEQLISQPGVPQKRVVHWLNLIVDLQITEAEDITAARQTLQRIIDLNPTAPEAEKARQRMLFLNLDAKGQRPGTSVAMATYEKKSTPPKSIPRLDPRFLPDFIKEKPPQ